VKKLSKKIKNIPLYAFIFKFDDYSVTGPLTRWWSDEKGLALHIRDIIDILIGFGSVVAVAMIIVSGITLITSTGDPDKVEQGQKTLTGAIIGLVIVWTAGLIIRTILTAFDIG
jgi:hypothetical protein